MLSEQVSEVEPTRTDHQKKEPQKVLRTTAVGRRKECRACWSGKMARLTTCVRVVHLCRGVLTHNTMCNLLHNIAVHLFALREKCVSSVCESEKSEMKVCFVPLHTAEAAPGDFQWRGQTAVSDHLPVRNHQPWAKCPHVWTQVRVLRSTDKNACQRAVRECADKRACGKVIIYTSHLRPWSTRSNHAHAPAAASLF